MPMDKIGLNTTGAGAQRPDRRVAHLEYRPARGFYPKPSRYHTCLPSAARQSGELPPFDEGAWGNDYL